MTYGVGHRMYVGCRPDEKTLEVVMWQTGSRK